MSPQDVLKLVKDREVKFVDFRFTDTRGKEQHVGVPVKHFGADKFENAFKDANQARSSALFVIASALAASSQKRIAELATKYRLPAIYPQENFVTNGGLISYGPDQAERYRRVASMVDKILKGTKPADLPVEQPTKFELVINLKAAKQIGLTIPPNVLVRADKVIK